tara:strand:+ start:481 stop:807 length:327 start_codon:yes stop_codon:yes gene_type:complete
VAETDAMRILAGKNGGPAGTASPSVVKLSQANAVSGECIENGGIDLASEATQITEAEVVCEDVEDIGFVGGKKWRHPCRDDKKTEQTKFHWCSLQIFVRMEKEFFSPE